MKLFRKSLISVIATFTVITLSSCQTTKPDTKIDKIRPTEPFIVC